MNLNIKELEDGEIEINGEIPAEEFDKFRDQTVKNICKDAELPGFRKGRAPENVLIKYVGESKILEEAAQTALNEHYPRILEENKIDAIGMPEITITKIAKGNPLGFKIKTSVMPAIKLPDYKKISFEVGSKTAEKDLKEKDKNRLKIIDKIIEKTDFKMPRLLVDLELDKMIHQFKHDISQTGIKFEDYLKNLKKTEEDIRKEWLKDAEKRSKLQLIVYQIAKEEDIKPTEEEIETQLRLVLSTHKGADPERARIYVENMLTNEKVFQFLESQK